jgi:uncharacterized phiE125 gp8 family phage protein
VLQVRLKPEVVTKPTAEPVTLSEVKKQLEIASSDTSHDTHLTALIGAAREQWEHDTDSATCFATYRIRLAQWTDGIELPKSPIHSITSIQYYDGANTLQAYPANQYQLHVDAVRLAYLQVLPGTVARWDAWTITYKVGYSEDGSKVPAIAKNAMLMLVAHYFENRDMLMAEAMQTMRPYEALVLRYMRSSYP